MSKNRILPSSTDALIYLSCSLFVFGFFVWFFPSASIHAEPFAETATTYFQQYPSLSAIDYLFGKDFGYYGVLPRALYLVIAGILGDRGFPEWTQTCALFTMSLTMSLFILDAFANVVASRWLRFVTVLLVASGHEYGMFLLHNLGYCFVFPVCYLLAQFASTSKEKTGMAIMSCVVAVFLWSKGFSIAAVPALLFGVFDRYRRREVFSAACFLSIIVASFPQFLAVFASRGAFGAKQVSLVTIVENVFYFYVYAWKHFTLGGSSGDNEAFIEFFGSLTAIVLIWVGVFRLRGKNAAEIRSVFIGSQALALGGIGLMVVAVANDPVYFFHVPGFGQDSYFFCTQVAILFGCGILVSYFIELIPRREWKFVSGVIVLCVFRVPAYSMSHAYGKLDPYSDKFKSASSWNTYYPLFKRDEIHCLPVNPPGWFFPSGCDVPALNRVKFNELAHGVEYIGGLKPGVHGVCIRDVDAAVSKLILTSTNHKIEELKSLREPGSIMTCFLLSRDTVFSPGDLISSPAELETPWKPVVEKMVFIY